MKILQIAVAGAGPRANEYMATIAKLSDIYRLCAVCDKNEQRAQASAKEHGADAVYADVDKMLQNEKPDVFFGLTPTDSLSIMTIIAAEHKANVIREIPIAITRQVAEAIIQSCYDNDVKLEVAENVWLWPHERLKRKIIEAGLLGNILHTRLWYTSGSYHGFNAMRMLTGKEAVRVLGYVGKVQVPPYTSYGGELMTTRIWESATIEFQDGITCLYEKPLPGPRQSLWEVEGTRGYLSGDELVLYRNGGNMRYQIQDVYEEVDGKQVLDHVCVDTEIPIVWQNPFKRYNISGTDEIAKANILYSMYRAVIEDIRKPEYGAVNALCDLELCVAVHESALHSNKWVDLPIQGTTKLEDQIHEEYKRKYGHDPVKGVESLKDAIFNRASVIWTIAGWL